MTIRRRHKRGATFGFGLVITEDDGTPSNLTGKTVTSHLRDQKDDDEEGDPVDEFDVAVVDAVNGVVEVSRGAGETVDWPLGLLYFDVRVTDDGDEDDVTISETIEMVVVREETRA